MESGMTPELTRRSFLRRSVAAAGGLFALAFVGPVSVAHADIRCTADCRSLTNCYTWWGPPSCGTSRVCGSSPNQTYSGCCECDCVPFPCSCFPEYVQAKFQVCNTGHCCCTCVPV